MRTNCADSHFLAFAEFVGVTRLELATSRPPDAYSNQLSYTPIELKSDAKVWTFFISSKFFEENFSSFLKKIFAILAFTLIFSILAILRKMHFFSPRDFLKLFGRYIGIIW